MQGRGVVVVETRVGGVGEVYADLRGVSVCIGREKRGRVTLVYWKNRVIF